RVNPGFSLQSGLPRPGVPRPVGTACRHTPKDAGLEAARLPSRPPTRPGAPRPRPGRRLRAALQPGPGRPARRGHPAGAVVPRARAALRGRVLWGGPVLRAQRLPDHLAAADGDRAQRDGGLLALLPPAAVPPDAGARAVSGGLLPGGAPPVARTDRHLFGCAGLAAVP